tara:strand:+ start:436 stop:1032 length:597 start_codon:yes stop_codon:yes gene_type:complete
MALRLKIEIDEIEPKIWRELIVPENLGLDTLHWIILGAIGWNGSHLHAFEIKNKRYIQWPSQDDLKDMPGWMKPEDDELDESQHTIGTLVRARQKFKYHYDFGDDWFHTVTVIERTKSVPHSDWPVCVGGERAGPPDDCGGPFGYMEILDALQHSRHPDHAEIKAYYGDLEPEIFSVRQANSLISALITLHEERVSRD